MGKYRQLFVDDYIISQMDKVNRVLNPAKRHPANPVLVAEHPWEGVDVYMYGAVLYDESEKRFKMWYTCWGPVSGMKGCYATSEDGIRWNKPMLGLHKFRSTDKTKATNITKLRGALGVIHSPDDPDPARRYKSMAGRRGVFSADGVRWETPSASKDIPGDVASDNVIPFSYDELGRRYIAFPKVYRRFGRHDRRSVSVTFSEDFLEWTPVQTVLVPDERDDELAHAHIAAVRDHVRHFEEEASWRNAQFYGMCGFPYQGMYLGLLWVLDVSGWGPERERGSYGGQDGPVQVQLVSSRDLLHWDRVGDRKFLITVGRKGSWEAGQIYTANRPTIVGDEIRIYYGGMGHTHGHPMYADSKVYPGIKTGIGFATLRLDGWVSIDAGEEEGTLTTKPLVFEGKNLVINAEAPQGSVAVEVLDQAGNVLPGFSQGECDVFSGDAIRYTVTWRGKSVMSTLVDKTVTIRFYLRKAKLYSFYFAS